MLLLDTLAGSGYFETCNFDILSAWGIEIQGNYTLNYHKLMIAC